MIEQTVLGIIQGIAEWLPISSEGCIALVKTHFFNHPPPSYEAIVQNALFLHFGSLLSAIIYFRKDIKKLFKSLINYPSADVENKKTIKFLFIVTAISGTIGFLLLKIFIAFSHNFLLTGKFITLIVGLCLLATAYLELKAENIGFKTPKDIKLIDGILLGITQGLATLPGLSRSGLTISTLLLRKFDKMQAIRLSFLMSIPVVLLGNLILNWNYFVWNKEDAVGLLLSFLLGLATIHVLLKFAEKINFGYFVGFFGILTLISIFI